MTTGCNFVQAGTLRRFPAIHARRPLWQRLLGAVMAAALCACAGGPPAPPAGAQAQPSAFAERLDLGQGLQLLVEARRFDPAQHRIVRCAGGIPCVIDGSPVFGVEGAMPALAVTRIALRTVGGEIELDHRGMYNPWSPKEGQRLTAAIVARDDDEIRVRGEFSDGSAAYIAEWWVVRGAAVRTLIDCVECVAQTCDRVAPKN